MEPSVEYIYTGHHINDYFYLHYNLNCPGMLYNDIVRVTFDDEFNIVKTDWQPRYVLKKDRVTYSVTCSKSQWKEMLTHFGGSLKETKRKVWNHES